VSIIELETNRFKTATYGNAGSASFQVNAVKSVLASLTSVKAIKSYFNHQGGYFSEVLGE